MKYTPYTGNGKPFLYAIFAPQDAEETNSVLEGIADRGYAIWPGVRYDRSRLDKAALVVLFLSPAAAADETIDRMVNYAVQKDKPMLVVHLAPTQLTPAQKLMLNTLQGILRYDCASEEEFKEKLFGSALLQDLRVTPAQKRAANRTTWLISAGVLLAVAAAIMFAIQSNAKIPDDSLAAQLGYGGKMKDITSILIYGDQIGTARSESSFAGQECDWENEQWRDTILYAGASEAADFGEISDISDFAQLKNLSELSVAGNQVSDISPLFELRKLEFLDIAGNPVNDLSGIEALESLKTLCIANTRINDLGPLDGCENLQTVFVDDSQYAAFTGESSEHAFTLVEVGPKEDLQWVSIHIFGGVEENGDPNSPYAFFVQTRSWKFYEDYEYAIFKNGEPVRITEIDRPLAFENGEGRKLHLQINQEDFGIYDSNAIYTVVISYKNWSATYQVWHKYDQKNASRPTCMLLDTSGF
jgi:hypothetical protein